MNNKNNEVEEKISVIAPVYMVEKYIEQCIESIINQTYKNLEIILIDDGTKDNCGKICDEYAKKDNRIKVIHKNNGGLSDARNVGIDASTGKYIAFVDSDDYIEKDMYEILFNNIKKYNADISACSYYLLYRDNRFKIDDRNITSIMEMNKEKALIEMNLQNSFGVAAWNKLYKKELWDNTRFPVGKVNEDVYIMYKMIYNCKKIVYDVRPKYYYRQRKNSITKTKKICYSPILANHQCIKFLKSRKLTKAIPNAYGSYIISCISVYNKFILKGNIKKKEKMEKKIRDIIKIKRKNAINYFSKKKKVQIVMLIYFPLIYKTMYRVRMSMKKEKYFD